MAKEYSEFFIAIQKNKYHQFCPAKNFNERREVGLTFSFAVKENVTQKHFATFRIC